MSSLTNKVNILVRTVSRSLKPLATILLIVCFYNSYDHKPQTNPEHREEEPQYSHNIVTETRHPNDNKSKATSSLPCQAYCKI